MCIICQVGLICRGNLPFLLYTGLHKSKSYRTTDFENNVKNQKYNCCRKLKCLSKNQKCFSKIKMFVKNKISCQKNKNVCQK